MGIGLLFMAVACGLTLKCRVIVLCLGTLIMMLMILVLVLLRVVG